MQGLESIRTVCPRVRGKAVPEVGVGLQYFVAMIEQGLLMDWGRRDGIPQNDSKVVKLYLTT